MKAIYAVFFGSILTFSACKKEETPTGGDPSNPGGNPTPTAEYYFQGDINGTNTLIEDAKSGYTANNGSQDDGNLKRSYATLSNSGDNNSLELLMIGDLGKSNPNSQEVYSLFQTGKQLFSDGTIQGIVINWKDDNGFPWTTDTDFTGNGNNNGNITISSIGAFLPGTSQFKVTGTINCRVYNIASEFRTIESGTFSLLFDASK